MSSQSANMTHSPFASSSPAFRAALTPPSGTWITRCTKGYLRISIAASIFRVSPSWTTVTAHSSRVMARCTSII